MQIGLQSLGKLQLSVLANAQNRPRSMPAWLLSLVAIVFIGTAVASPLAVYTITLAAFGLPHVLSELRYVDRRFIGKFAHGRLAILVILLLAIVVVRTSSVFHIAPSSIALPLELSLVACLALTVAGETVRQRVTAVSIALVIGLMTAINPFDTAVGFSIFHNLTPLGFLWQITPQEKRNQTMSWALVCFVLLPLFVASGIPRMIAVSMWNPGLAFDPLGAGPLVAHLFVYVPPSLFSSEHAIDFFTASVVAQGAHYFAVIVLLPRLLARAEPDAKGIFPWPTAYWFWITVITVGVAGFIRFTVGFADARSLYGIFSSMHAWIEIPILILALCSKNQSNKVMPINADATLATTEMSMAR